jgi:hypothetical protein
MPEYENMPNRYIDVQPGRKSVGMQVNVWRDERGLIHVTCDGDGPFHGNLKPGENAYGHFRRVLERAGRWDWSSNSGAA